MLFPKPLRRTTQAVQPDNLSTLAPNGFRLVIDHIPHAVYFNNQVFLPGVSQNPVLIGTPSMVDLWAPGDKLVFDDFRFSFQIDEDLINYEEIVKWTRHNAINSGNERIFSDATLTILTNNMNPNRRIRFFGMFPYMITEIPFTTMEGPDVPIQADVVFKYSYWEFLPRDTSST